MNAREEFLLQQADNYVNHVCNRMMNDPNGAMESCQITHAEFSDQHAKQLADAIPLAEKLVKIEITKCAKLTGQGVAHICNGLRQSCAVISTLSFAMVPIGDDGLGAIQQLLESDEHSLKVLCLEEIGSISPSVWDVFLSVTSRRVQSLDLSRNQLSKDRIEELCAGLEESTNSLKALILSENPIGDEGMQRLCNAIARNHSIILLAVGDCQITDLGIQALNMALRSNCSLQRLYVYSNPGVNLYSVDNLQVRYWLDLNAGRRAFLHSNGCLPAFLPKLLENSSKRPELLYGLMRENPPAWLTSHE